MLAAAASATGADPLSPVDAENAATDGAHADVTLAGTKRKRKRGNVPCPLCPKKFCRRNEMMRHLLDRRLLERKKAHEHVSAEAYAAAVKEVRGRKRARRSSRDPSKRLDLHCPLCHTAVSTLPNLQAHSRNVGMRAQGKLHKGKTKQDCEDAYEAVASRVRAEREAQRLTVAAPTRRFKPMPAQAAAMQCPLCPRCLSSMQSLKLHLHNANLLATGKAHEGRTLDECKEAFETVRAASGSRPCARRRKHPMFVCGVVDADGSECGKPFASHRGYLRHVNEDHGVR